MNFEIVSPILGFEGIESIELRKIDDIFATAIAPNGVSWSLVNPFVLRKYLFEIPLFAQILLDINSDSELEVYCMLVLQNPLEDSKVNFLAPLVFNLSNKKATQLVFLPKEYPEFAVLDSLKTFVR